MSNLKYFQFPIGNEVFQLLSNKALQKVRELSEMYDRYSNKNYELTTRAKAIDSLINENKKLIENLENSLLSNSDEFFVNQTPTIRKNIEFDFPRHYKSNKNSKKMRSYLQNLIKS